MRSNNIFFEERLNDVVYVGYLRHLETRKPRNRPSKYRGSVSISRHSTELYDRYQKTCDIQQMIEYLNALETGTIYDWVIKELGWRTIFETQLNNDPTSYWTWNFQRGYENQVECVGSLKDAAEREEKYKLRQKLEDAQRNNLMGNRVRDLASKEAITFAGKYFPVKQVLRKIMVLRLSDQHH
jgi:hypothetical protein